MPETIKTPVRERISLTAQDCLSKSSAEAVEIAISMLEKALREGQHEPEAKVSASVVIRYFGGEWQFESDAKAEKKDVEKVEKVSASFDPNQPELF